MTIRAYLRVFRERWRLIVVITALTVGLAALITAVTPKVYQSTAQVFVSSNASSDPLAQYQAAFFVQSQVSTYAKIATSPDVIHSVKADLNLALTDAEVKAKISADAPTNTTLVNIHATDADPNASAAIANSAARAFVSSIQKYSASGPANTPAVRLYVTDPAVAPSKPVKPNALLNLILGAVVGLFLGAALAVTREIMDNRIKDADILALTAGAPTMGVIVEDATTQRHPIATRAGTKNVRAENYRQLRANLQFANVDNHPRVIAVTSSIPSEGKTTVAINLASTLAEAGFTVCLVDADLRRPTIAKVLGLVSPVGLTSVLIHQIDMSDALQSAGSNFYVLTSGPTPPNPSEVLASSYVRTVIRSLLDKVDYVIIDTAPLLPVADASEVAALADGALLVARQGVTTDTHIRRAVQTLNRVDAALLGVVLNRVPGGRKAEYGYSYYRAPTEVQAHDHRGARRDRSKRSKASVSS
ncbi:MAG: polysaccharide biosynthesis tyrosine autokinase [Actinomycetota bacterium]|nr:polysaccharide biosynthesis tyrosine autokinase [Actinomycetota bacterium]